MVSKWDDSLISSVQQANDIVDIISEYLSLTKRGKEFVGLCPFHADHRPSMYVSPAKQIFKCFACGAGGDVLKFVQMKENLTFVQAVERLAQRAGIALPAFRSRQTERHEGTLSPAELAKINAWAMKHWTANLWNETKGAAARQYLAQRRISEDTARTWMLGLALDSWDDLLRKAAQDKIPEKTLIEAGLAVPREAAGGCYDK
ncbi:MAG TPA: DNA primase, partial [Phycisphaerales bacterium]|nr:DNA primase [Phycisphaerales bacterium]